MPSLGYAEASERAEAALINALEAYIAGDKPRFILERARYNQVIESMPGIAARPPSAKVLAALQRLARHMLRAPKRKKKRAPDPPPVDAYGHR
jgi:hypothetical protein